MHKTLRKSINTLTDLDAVKEFVLLRLLDSVNIISFTDIKGLAKFEQWYPLSRKNDAKGR